MSFELFEGGLGDVFPLTPLPASARKAEPPPVPLAAVAEWVDAALVRCVDDRPMRVEPAPMPAVMTPVAEALLDARDGAALADVRSEAARMLAEARTEAAKVVAEARSEAAKALAEIRAAVAQVSEATLPPAEGRHAKTKPRPVPSFSHRPEKNMPKPAPPKPRPRVSTEGPAARMRTLTTVTTGPGSAGGGDDATAKTAKVATPPPPAPRKSTEGRAARRHDAPAPMGPAARAAALRAERMEGVRAPRERRSWIPTAAAVFAVISVAALGFQSWRFDQRETDLHRLQISAERVSHEVTRLDAASSGAVLAITGRPAAAAPDAFADTAAVHPSLRERFDALERAAALVAADTALLQAENEQLREHNEVVAGHLARLEGNDVVARVTARLNAADAAQLATLEFSPADTDPRTPLLASHTL